MTIKMPKMIGTMRLVFLRQLIRLPVRLLKSPRGEKERRAKLARLVPDNDVDYAHDRAEKRAYLNRARAFADPLDPKFNTLKASILHEFLVLDQAEGTPNPDTFLAFIRLPRPSPLARTSWLDQAPLESRVAPDSEDYLDCHLPPVPADDRLVREYLEHFLATVASSAPFVGLFGTVWGIYHALIAIGMSGQGTLDKVAGPVGEALIMTGIGLAVAIPAAVAYNHFARANRSTLSQLNSFAYDVFAFLSTGVKTSPMLTDARATSEKVIAMARAQGHGGNETVLPGHPGLAVR